MDKRVKFDFAVIFSNGGGLQGQDFRLDIAGDDITDEALAEYLVRDLRLLMVERVSILKKEIISEPHKRLRPGEIALNNAERQHKIESYGKAHEQLAEAIRAFPVEMWQFRAAPDGWTIHEIMIHIADSEVNSYVRCRRAIAEPGSAVLGYNEVEWAKALHYHEQSTDEALELFKCLRRASYELIKTLPDSVWVNTIEHSENGTMTLEDWLIDYEDHIPAHIAQMRAVYEAWVIAEFPAG